MRGAVVAADVVVAALVAVTVVGASVVDTTVVAAGVVVVGVVAAAVAAVVVEGAEVVVDLGATYLSFGSWISSLFDGLTSFTSSKKVRRASELEFLFHRC